jgi:hypothetical protein
LLESWDHRETLDRLHARTEGFRRVLDAAVGSL